MSRQPEADRGASRGLAMVLAAAAAMGTLGPLAGVASAAGVGSATFSALRAAVGASLLGLLLLWAGQPHIRLRGLAARQRALLGVAVAVNGCMNLALFLAFGEMAVGLVMAVYYTYPLIVTLVDAWLGREAITPLRLAALALAGVGVAVLLGSRMDPGAHATLPGLVLAGVAATCHAAYLLAVRGGFDDVPGVQATSLVLAGGILISGTGAVLLGELASVHNWIASPSAWLAVAGAGTLGALPKVWVIGGVRRIGSTRAALAMTFEPLVAVVVAAVLLGQWLRPVELLGGAAILAAMTFVQSGARGGSSVPGHPDSERDSAPPVGAVAAPATPANPLDAPR